MIRQAAERDLPSILEIYNQAVRVGFQTADMDPVSVQDRKEWFRSHDSEYPVFVYEEEKKVLGWLSLSPYRRGRRALQEVVEVSYYIHQSAQRRGIASQLMERGIDTCRGKGYLHLLAILLDVNQPSIALLEKYGFQQWGHLPEIVNFDGKICGQLYYGLHLNQ